MLRRFLIVSLALIPNCRYRDIPEDLFIYPIKEGTIWYYEENVGDTLSVVDSIVVLKDTIYTYESQTVPAWRVQKSHEAYVGIIIDTNTTFIYKNTIIEKLPTKGLFPDSIYYNNQWIRFRYNEDSIVVVWLPLRVKPGDRWEMARGSGTVYYGSLECPMNLVVNAEVKGYEDITYKPITKRFINDTLLYSSDSLIFKGTLRVEYYVKTNMCAIPLEVTLLTIWWKSGVGPVKNEALGYPSDLITHLVGWKRP